MLWSIIGRPIRRFVCFWDQVPIVTQWEVGLKAAGFFTFIDKLDGNLCEMCVRDLARIYLILWVFFLPFFLFFFFLFFEDTKTELACVWVRFWSGRGPGHGIFFCRSSCLCLLFPHRATWHCLRFVSGPGEFQCATISYGKFCYSKHDGLPFIPLTHTHTHTCVSVGRRRQSTERNNNNNKLK